MSPIIQTILLISLGLGTTVTFSSSHWLLAWIGLEINTLAIIPLIAQQHHPRATEAATKYFLTQAAAAALILFAAFSNAWISSQWDISMHLQPISALLIVFALSLKLGLAPMHFWLPEVIQGLDLTTGIILSTWQKLAPFSLLYQIMPSEPELISCIAICSILTGGLGGLNQTQLRKILAYSSIAHLGWIALALQFNQQMALLALLLYIPATFSIFITLKRISSTTMNLLATSWAKVPLLTIITSIVLLSLGGLPPLTGFLPKWFILQEVTKNDIILMALVAALGALLSLYFYLRLIYAFTLTISPNTLNSTVYSRTETEEITPCLAWTLTISTMALPAAPLILAALCP